MSHLVRGVMARSSASGLSLKPCELGTVDDHRRAVGDQHHLGIRHPVWRRNDHLVAGVQGGQHGVEDHLLAARGDDGLRRFVLQPVVALELGADRLAQRRRAGHGGVPGVVVADRLDGSFLDMVRRRKVGLPRRQADHVLAGRLHLQELALCGIGGRGLDAAKAVGDESHWACASLQAWKGRANLLMRTGFRKPSGSARGRKRAISLTLEQYRP